MYPNSTNYQLEVAFLSMSSLEHSQSAGDKPALEVLGRCCALKP